MAEKQPLINPTLRLMIEPVLEGVEGRGKGRNTIRFDRLASQAQSLMEDIDRLERRRLKSYAGKTLLIAEMFEDSLAPTHTPTDLFERTVGCRLIAPLSKGYVVESDSRSFARLRERMQAASLAVKSDISRVRSIKAFTYKNALAGRSVNTLWDSAVEGDTGRYFALWLRPFHDQSAREALLSRFEGLALTTLKLANKTTDRRDQTRQTIAVASVGRALRQYRETRGIGRAIVSVPQKSQLARIIASGTVFRIDPIKPLHLAAASNLVTNVTMPTLTDGPVVAVIDGGLNDKSYLPAQQWIAPSIIPDKDANTSHGNAVSSLIVHAGELNLNLQLPKLGCKIGTAQAVPSDKSNTLLLPDALLDMLSHIALRHRDTRVWNMSFNVVEHDVAEDEISALGHDISVIARTTGVLPVISVGNVSKKNHKLLAPADCEAAITVGGRVATKSGAPDKHCSKCCHGPGPGGMLKPELSWFSPVKVGGNLSMQGSSFSTALVSVLAAHTFENLKSPTPDMVKALLINKAERDSHDAQLGWGTPYDGAPPWECAPGTVSMIWQSTLEPSLEYHWDGIRIPKEMIANNTLLGGAKLTAILQPVISPFAGPNYFCTRIEVALQHQDGAGEWKNLIGTLKESSLAEMEARTELKKWQPIRHHANSRFRRGFSGDSFRLRARLYTRDLYQPGLPTRETLPPQRVAFVLTLRSPTKDPAIYGSVVRDLGNYVESAVISQDIHV